MRVRCGVLTDACRVDETNAGLDLLRTGDDIKRRLERELGESLGAG